MQPLSRLLTDLIRMSSFILRSCQALRHRTVLRRLNGIWQRMGPVIHHALAASVYRHGVPVVINGDRFLVDYSYRGLANDYEPAFYEAFVSSLRPGMTVLDLGAHIGLFTLGAAARTRGTGRILSFEPAPGPYRMLQRHLDINSLAATVTAFPYAVSDADGSLEFFTHRMNTVGSLDGAHTERFRALDPGAAIETLRVRSVTLDSFCAQFDVRPDVIKIDVEGAENQVLRGGREMLRLCRPVLFCEVHPHQDEESNAVVKLAAELGYTHHLISPANQFGIYQVCLRPMPGC